MPKKESLFKPRVSYKERYQNETRIKEHKRHEVLSLLLDSSLISPTHTKKANIKIIECGDYKELYIYPKKREYNKKEYEEVKKFDINYLFKNQENRSRVVVNKELKTIEYKNILRSKMQLQRIVKSNEEEFKTFITLTFADNVTDIEEANKKFDIWRTKIKSIKKDFKYVCVPEFQKRGAVHYHLLTNLEINKDYEYTRRGKQLKAKLIIPQDGKDNQYDVKYWSYGFTSVFSMKDINVIGYITKYMTKDLDNRLWGKRRYLYSSTLKKPIEKLVDFDELEEFSYFIDLLNTHDLVYEKSYIDYFNDDVIFKEYKNFHTSDLVYEKK